MGAAGGGGFDFPERRPRAVFSLAPLIDVTFILLIFFMLVTQFERYGPVDVTLSGSQLQPLEDRPSAAASVRKRIVEIRANGTLIVDRRVMSLSEFSALFADDEGEASRAVLLKPEPDVPLQTLIDVLGAVQTIPGITTQILTPPLPKPEGGE
jgi:biopolymer transport protein ExbD